MCIIDWWWWNDYCNRFSTNGLGISHECSNVRMSYFVFTVVPLAYRLIYKNPFLSKLLFSGTLTVMLNAFLNFSGRGLDLNFWDLWFTVFRKWLINYIFSPWNVYLVFIFWWGFLFSCNFQQYWKSTFSLLLYITYIHYQCSSSILQAKMQILFLDICLAKNCFVKQSSNTTMKTKFFFKDILIIVAFFTSSVLT